ncbi:hypothetical protein FN846DRAFT_893819 [Sphaerosporella brunnea]|uniref:Uncharacterized protein n=1 Tax=Sphaerosporella brunnea TaxID=1250544 RepID=A0A5J5EK65_9PEZI|nr:hypothetical protein FN846DRAFT_893819 [Sphaerosporella brunnea]
MAARFQAAPSSAEGSQTAPCLVEGFQAASSLSEGFQAAPSSAEDEIEALYKKMADTHYRAAGARTLSGLKNSSFDAFLYKRRIIFRERVQTEASGIEVNSDPDSQQPVRPAKRQKTQAGRRHSAGPTPTEQAKHLVRCCHCSKTEGPYNAEYTTTSAWKRHVELHRGIPAEEPTERQIIKEIRKEFGQASNPWTKATM